MSFYVFAFWLTVATFRAAFRRLLTGYLLIPRADLLGGDSLSSSNVDIIFTNLFGARAVLCFLSFIAISVLRLTKVLIGTIKEGEVNSLFDNPQEPSSVPKNFVIRASNVPLMTSL